VAVDLHAFWSRRGKCLPADIEMEDGITVRRYGLWHGPGCRYLLKALSLFPHRAWQCMTLPSNPICWAMWRDAGALAQPFDVVHASAFPYAWPIICARRLARRLAIPFFLTPFLHLGDLNNRHDPTRRAYTSPALCSLLRSADQVFVQTESERETVLGLSVPPRKVVLQGLGVEPAECTGGDRLAARRRWGAGDAEIVIGHLANNSQEKGSVDLLKAAERLWRAGCCFRLVLAGSEMPNFQRFWRDYPFQQRVIRLGPLTVEAKRDFFAGIDVFALPSRSDSFGLVLLEAWANGLPNVAYRAGGIADLIRSEQDGLLIRCGDISGLAAALAWMIQDSTLRQQCGQEGKRKIERMRWEDKLQIVRRSYKACRVSRETRPTDFRRIDGSRSSTYPTG
jgi:glycosyltransferase involved in cell wall biosynthesis